MPSRRFQAVREALKGAQSVQKGGNRPAEVAVPVKAAMQVTVRRFQGVYECGCPAPPLGEPENCEIHDKPRSYHEENVGTFDATAEKEG